MTATATEKIPVADTFPPVTPQSSFHAEIASQKIHVVLVSLQINRYLTFSQ
jgi:hypothetical protein